MQELIEIARDKRLRVRAGEPVVAMEGGLQPFLFRSSQGTLVMQAQLRRNLTAPRARWSSPGAWGPPSLGTGKELATLRAPRGPRRGEPRGRRGRAQRRHDPHARYLCRPRRLQRGGCGRALEHAGRLEDPGRPPGRAFLAPPHQLRRIRRRRGTSTPRGAAPPIHPGAPGRELLTTIYSWYAEDTAPAAYMPSMKKTRSIIARSGTAASPGKKGPPSRPIRRWVPRVSPNP